MRLISLILALVFLSAIIIYYKDSGVMPATDSNQTVADRAQQTIDQAKEATAQMNQAIMQHEKRMQETGTDAEQ
jgi:hypothetical protein